MRLGDAKLFFIKSIIFKVDNYYIAGGRLPFNAISAEMNTIGLNITINLSNRRVA